MQLVIEDEPPGPPAVPHAGECVVCFVDRMTHAHGCSGELMWARMWRDRSAPRATALERRLGSKGGFCDCEVLINAYVRREYVRARLSQSGDEDGEQVPPPCLGVAKGSSQPCHQWTTWRRGSW